MKNSETQTQYNIITLCLVLREVEFRALEDRDKVGQLIWQAACRLQSVILWSFRLETGMRRKLVAWRMFLFAARRMHRIRRERRSLCSGNLSKRHFQRRKPRPSSQQRTPADIIMLSVLLYEIVKQRGAAWKTGYTALFILSFKKRQSAFRHIEKS